MSKCTNIRGTLALTLGLRSQAQGRGAGTCSHSQPFLLLSRDPSSQLQFPQAVFPSWGLASVCLLPPQSRWSTPELLSSPGGALRSGLYRRVHSELPSGPQPRELSRTFQLQAPEAVPVLKGWDLGKTGQHLVSTPSHSPGQLASGNRCLECSTQTPELLNPPFLQPRPASGPGTRALRRAPSCGHRDPGSPAGRGCSHKAGWLKGFQPGWPRHISPSWNPPGPQAAPCLALAVRTHQPRTTLTEATWAHPEVSAMSSQTSLRLPWQPGSEKRIIWRGHRGNPQAPSPDPGLLLPPTALPPPTPHGVPPLPFQA